MVKTDTNMPIIPIGHMANILKIHQRTLRIYDKEGILIPKRNTKNRRYYTISDIEKAKFILFLTRNLSLNLNGIKIILGILKKENIGEENYTEYINSVAEFLNMDTEFQKNNAIKHSKKGRKSNS